MNYTATLVFLLLSGFLGAQTNLSGVINQYAAVTDYSACSARLTVDDATGFNPGDPIIIMQMRGLSLNETNTSSFGEVNFAASNNAYWEHAEIASISGNDLFLVNIPDNDIDPTQTVQIISYPQFTDAITNGTVSAQPWNGQTGGVVAFSVTGTLELVNDIDVSGQGFRGGQLQVVTSGCNFAVPVDDYFFDANDWQGAAKGESAAEFVTDKENGRGKWGTGGGGGNDHNAGGGGGANFGAGGQGGRQIPESFFGCKGNFPGLGGVTSGLVGRFLGGGGGAGHVDNAGVGSGGANGGGIVIIDANEIVVNGATGVRIFANGADANDTNGDGAGGGGGGGVISVRAQTITPGGLSLFAEGGKGGDNVGNATRCNAPGGGGGGGLIQHLPAAGFDQVSVAGGSSGVVTGSLAECSNATNEAQDGTDGTIDNVFFLSEGTLSPDPFQITQALPGTIPVCEGASVELSIVAQGNDLSYQWQQFDGTNWVDLNNGGTFNNVTTPTLQLINVPANFDDLQLRVVVTNNCDGTTLESATTLSVIALPNPSFTATDNGSLSVDFSASGTGGFGVQWDFGDMTGTATDPNTTYTYANPGTYTVTLTVFTPCGPIEVNQVVSVAAANVAPTALFSFDAIAGCNPLVINFQNGSTGTNNTYEWTFPGGNPTTSTDPNPTVTYTNSGTFTFTLVATNSAGSDSNQQTASITVDQAPTVPSFTATTNSLDVDFSVDLPEMGVTYTWNFGDASPTTTGPDVTHTYASAGNYPVTLTATNDCGTQTTTQTVTVEILVAPPVALFTFSETNGCTPLSVDFSNGSTGNGNTYAWTFENGTPATSTDPNPTVIFNQTGTFDVTLTATNTGGTSTSTQQLIVIVGQGPLVPQDNITTNGLSISYAVTNVQPGTQYSWDFGDNAGTATSTNGAYVYASPGNYTVILTATNNCGSETISVPVTVQEIQIIAIDATITAGCAPLLVSFQNQSMPTAPVIEWNFAGGDPATSTDSAPQVLYEEPGSYDVTVTVQTASGPQTLTFNDYIQLEQQPIANFNFTLDGPTVQFQNFSQFADAYSWNFGDGSTPSSAFSPTHTYTQNGLFEINLVASNAFCGSGLTIPVLIDGVVSTEDLERELGLRVFPNPVRDQLYIRVDEAFDQGALYGSDGERITILVPGTDTIDFTRLPSGVYLLELQFNQSSITKRIVKP